MNPTRPLRHRKPKLRAGALIVALAACAGPALAVLPTPIAYWPFDDEGPGGITADLSPNGYDAFVNGSGTAFVAGHSGAEGDFAIDFDGFESSVTSDIGLLSGLVEFSMSGWVSFDLDQLARTGLFGQNDAVEFGMINATTMEFWMPGAGALQTPFGPATDGWVHIAVVSDGTTRRIYIDGAQAASGAAASPVASTAFTFNIGGGGILDAVDTNGNWFLGQIDDVAVWDVALSAQEVASLASGAESPIDGGLVNDFDGDMLPNIWEEDNGLDPLDATGDNGKDGDPDSDGSTNFEELGRLTDPMNPDTDGDGVRDGAETGTGTYVDENNTGTDPLDPDTDGDSLADGREDNSGTPGGFDNPGTNPNDPDTDDDGWLDGAEVTAGTNPHDAGSQPVFPVPIAYWPFDDEGAGGTTTDVTVNAYHGTINGIDTAFVPGHSGEAGDFAIDFDGFESSVTTPASLSGLSAFTMSGWVNFDFDQLARTGLFGQNDAVEFGMISATTMEFWMPGAGALQTPFGPATDGWVHVTVVSDGSTRTIYLDGFAAASGASQTPIANTPFGFNIGGGGIQDAEGNFFLGQIDDVVVYDVALDADQVLQLASGVVNPIGTGSDLDSDGDGLPDWWEVAFGLDPNDGTGDNGAGGDPDDDDSINSDELARRTNPSDEDTDGDGARDGAESDTGTFVSTDDTGTDPLDPDTDGDGLADGLETNSGEFNGASDPGTHPLNPDTDGDLTTDGAEVVAGTDPLDATSSPTLPTPIAYWPFDDQGAGGTTADRSPNGYDAFVDGFGTGFVAGRTGRAGDYAVDFDGIDSAVSAGLSLLGGLEAFSASGWVRFDAPQAARTGLFGQNDAIEFGMINATTLEFWMPGDGIGAIQAPLGPTTDGWVHVTIVSDEFDRFIYLDGVEVAFGITLVPVADSGFPFNIGGGGIQDNAGNYFLGQIDDVAVWDIALTPDQVGLLAAGTPPIPGETPPPVDPGFAITSVEFDPGTREISITFASESGVAYAGYSSDEGATWTEFADVVATGSESTVTTVIPAGVETRLFRIGRVDN